MMINKPQSDDLKVFWGELWYNARTDITETFRRLQGAFALLQAAS